jgi:hypothetical protein
MGTSFTHGQKVVTSDDRTIGRAVGERDDCVLVETGHIFKSTHAIPASFLHESEGMLRATVSKDIVDASPKVDGDDWSCEQVLLHYGLAGPFQVDPDPDGVDSAETAGAREGIEPAPHERIGALGETERPGYDRPAVRERSPNVNDPAGSTANRGQPNGA